MAIRMRGAVVASSGFAALLVACLLSAGGPNLASAQWDWTSQLLPDYKAQTQTIMRQLARMNRTYYSRFPQIFASFFKSGDLVIDQDATILVPSDDGFLYCRKARDFDNLTRKQKLRLLRYYILKGRYTAQQLFNAAPNRLFPTFDQNLPLNKTVYPQGMCLEPVPQKVIWSTGWTFGTGLGALNAGLTRNIAAHGATWGIEPPNL
ncbi:unnamed protein product [Closterium sp. NIES-64]|nr:unnamed protein product [Closterium sp. NIES-64]CAI5956316.1 unnamed protein product [Closterium sp. NIES-64]